MLTIAKQNQFDHILKQTWSCWFLFIQTKNTIHVGNAICVKNV